ncbi:Acetyl-coenzyme A carboxylase carboxyl transferase subunit beta [Planctomycetes bacterium Pan216]|uniref:Acetyl-coenzyme A carboxylase carboxyl transferase subunit beta n=1 Tax=Kolteria novifilia TaxID=2527975 RepID=A0A518BCP9_9BACT|nr:Acetyl-coenzyme A carboxylase carboxyl transferase subunit beta [Planctomycetes bacterium Pan216]
MVMGTGQRRTKRGVPEGLWMSCPDCKATLYTKDVEQAQNVCPQCGHHFYISARRRLDSLLDQGSLEEWFTDVRPKDPLEFVDRKAYKDRLRAEQKKTDLNDAIVCGRGFIRGRPLAVCVTDSAFSMGSMGSVVGEMLVRSIERAIDLSLPIVIVSASGGGARMQEGILSLMQMAKVSAALGRLSRAGGLYISVLTNPTMGGVAASFASLGDICLAEPRALIGFAGPRTIWATVRIELPKGFQTSEFLLEHGFVDRIVSRHDMRGEISRIFDYCGK